MKNIRLILLALVMFIAMSAYAQVENVEFVKVKPSKMTAPVECTVILPEEYHEPGAEEARYPVLYLLHGHDGNSKVWLEKKPELAELVNVHGVIIVCPDGKNSWYWDSPINSESQYETFIAKDLVNFIDTNYRTISSPSMRAITGLSMGGHGALFVALRHPDVFLSCGSMSGGVDIRPFPDSWNMKDALGEYASNKELWDKSTVINLVEGLNTDQNIVIDCGVDDFFIGVNRNLHKALVDAKIDHDYSERPGGHTWQFWCNALDYQMIFFAKVFDAVP